jgi:hypothetical protein
MGVDQESGESDHCRDCCRSGLAAALPSDDAKTVVLNFVQPLAAVRQLCRFDRKAARDEPGREGTLQPAD